MINCPLRQKISSLIYRKKLRKTKNRTHNLCKSKQIKSWRKEMISAQMKKMRRKVFRTQKTKWFNKVKMAHTIATERSWVEVRTKLCTED